jgi:hypothetical protein
VVVDTDFAIPGELDSIAVEITGPQGTTETERTTLGSRAPLPLTLGVVPSSALLGPIDVVAIGGRGADEIARRHQRVTLVHGETRMLLLHLSAACREVTCPFGQTCSETGCVDIEIDPVALPPWTGSPPRLGEGADGGVPDDALPPGDGGPARCGIAADCDDDDPCTDDACTASGCVHANNDSACDDDIFCNGVDVCAGGECTHAGGPCLGATTCDESSARCLGCVTTSDCPAQTTSAWTACDFGGDPCAESGTRARTVTDFRCESGACVPTVRPESATCDRETDGTLCIERTCDSWTECTGASMCAETGTRTRACRGGSCVAGVCTESAPTETEACTRSTGGGLCAAGTCGEWRGCTYPSGCATTGSESRTCTADARCTGGACPAQTTFEETRACSRVTEGTVCGVPSCGDWITACEPTSTSLYECPTTGTHTRVCSPSHCDAAGACGPGGPVTMYEEVQPCPFDPSGMPCVDGWVCTSNDQCSRTGSCMGSFRAGCIEP